MTNADTHPELAQKYDRAAGRWRDKMRALGYYDAYLGFLSAPGLGAPQRGRVVDMGSGTAAFAEAWVAVNGAPGALHLVDLSPAMLDRGKRIIADRGIAAQTTTAGLGAQMPFGPADEVLAAHLIEHIASPAQALRDLRDLLVDGGRLRLIVSKPHWCNAIIWLQWRHRTFGLDEIKSLLAEAGFELEAIYDFPAGPPSRTSRGFVARKV